LFSYEFIGISTEELASEGCGGYDAYYVSTNFSKRDCLMRIKVIIAIFRSKALFKGF